jgi:molybdenum cofactor cytidylyltransferase
MTVNSDAKIGGLLLAAGGSQRMGTPKQLLEFEGKTLLCRSAETLAKSKCALVVVILGAEAERSKAEIANLPVSAIVNDDWESGMSSSIRTGLEKLLELKPEIDAVMITLCDQPFVTTEKIDLFVNAFADDISAIIAARYNEVLGVPALFAKSMFGDLLALEGDKGARDLIRKSDSVVSIDLPEAAFDLDTMDDWKKAGKLLLD